MSKSKEFPCPPKRSYDKPRMSLRSAERLISDSQYDPSLVNLTFNISGKIHDHVNLMYLENAIQKQNVSKTMVNNILRILSKPRTMKTKKRPGKVALTIPAKKNNYWEIYKYTSKGKPTWGNRLVSPNGKIITGNKDFNRKQIAIDNVNLVKEGC